MSITKAISTLFHPQISSGGDIKTSLVAIDATCQPGDNQYRDPVLLRELNKAYVGFLQTELLSSSHMGGGGELSESIYLDAVDQSQMSTEGDFETASEGLDSHPSEFMACLLFFPFFSINPFHLAMVSKSCPRI